MIPVSEPLFSGNEKKYLAECIDTAWISSEGPFVKRFEQNFAAYIGKHFGIAVANGSAALDVALASLNLKPGDEVIMPAFTIISCALAIVRTGAVPVLVDAEPDTWNMDVSQIRAKITSKTKAIMAVHIYGLPVNMQPLMELAEEYGLTVIEDTAEAIGQTCAGRKCGSFGRISCFSFYANKNITTGEGGMILTDDPELAERCRSFRNLCFPKKRAYIHEGMGWNYRMTNLQAAIGCAQLEKIDEHLRLKRAIGLKYQELLADCGSIILPPDQTDYAENLYWIFGIVLKDSVRIGNEEFCDKLKEHGIGTRLFFSPMNQQPVLQKMGLFKDECYPVSEMLAKRGFYVPSGLPITEDQMKEVVTTVKKIIIE